MPINAKNFLSLIKTALDEDLGGKGDITSLALIPENASATAEIKSREPGICAGLPVALEVFVFVDDSLKVTPRVKEGEKIKKGQTLATVQGNARSILLAERTALNLLGRLCDIATKTRQMADLIGHTNAKLLDTRKTTAGLRALEKYAVKCGGGINHRFGLFDAVLIKDNHLAVVKDPAEAVAKARKACGKSVKIEIEVDTLEQLQNVLNGNKSPDVILLDNMNSDTLREAVHMVRQTSKKIKTEASGGVKPSTIKAIAETGIDYISSGHITHSAQTLDIGLDFHIQQG